MSARIHHDPAGMPRDGAHALRRELSGEGAAALGRLGRAVETLLAELRALTPDAEPARRERLLYACADAVWCYFVQREACGLVGHERVVEAYAIPREVLVCVGASPP